MNIYSKFQFYPPYGFRKYCYIKCNLSVAMAINRKSDRHNICAVDRGLLEEHFCEAFVKI